MKSSFLIGAALLSTLLPSEGGLCAELGGHPDFFSVSEAALLVVPEHALIKGLFNGLPGGWLSQKVDLVRFVLHLLLHLVLFKVLVV